MKILLAVTLLTAAVATPALAQTTLRTQDQWRGPYAYGQNYSAYAYVNGQRRLDNRDDVYDISGHYLGSDPDSSVRSQLAHDPRQGD